MSKIGKYKFTIVIFIELICIICILPGCFKKEEILTALDGNSLYEQSGQYMSDQIGISPGVYQVQVSLSGNLENTISVELTSDSGYEKSILGNSVTIFQGSEYMDFEVWVTGRIPYAYLRCQASANDLQNILNITVCKTNLGNRIAFIIFTVCFILLDISVIMVRKALQGEISIKKQIVFFGICAVVVIAYLPYLSNYIYLGADTGFHLLRIEGLKQSIQDGIPFPVRVQSYCNYGHGSLVPAFYSNFFLFFPALLCLMGFPLMTAYKIFMLGFILLQTLTTYCALKKMTCSEYASLFGTAFNLLAPYHYFNLYNRGAVGEYTAMAFLPLLCCGTFLLLTENPENKDYKYYKWWIVIGMTGVLQCHLLSAEMAAIAMLIVCIIFIKKVLVKKTLIQFFQSVIITLLLNCWFLIPMLCIMRAEEYNISTIYASSIQGEGLKISELMDINILEKPSTTIGIIIICFLVYYIFKAHGKNVKKQGSIEQKCVIFGLMTIAVTFMATNLFPWDTIEKIAFLKPFVTAIQFPTRFLSIALLMGAVFASYVYLYISDRESIWNSITVIVMIAAIILEGLYVTKKVETEYYSPTQLYTAENKGTTDTWNTDYTIAGLDVSDIYFHGPKTDEGIKYRKYVKKGTTITMYLENDTADTLYLELPLTGYYGYDIQSSPDNEETPYLTSQRGEHEDIRVAVPGGYSGNIKISYCGNYAFHIADAVSIVTIIIIAIQLIKKLNKKINKKLFFIEIKQQVE